MAAKENLLDRHFDQFGEAKLIKMAIQKNIIWRHQPQNLQPQGFLHNPIQNILSLPKVAEYFSRNAHSTTTSPGYSPLDRCV